MEDHQNEVKQTSFFPSKNILLLPITLFILGIGLLVFSFFNRLVASSETRIISWGFMIVGLFGSTMGWLHRKRFLLLINGNTLTYIPDQQSEVKNEIRFDQIRRVTTQQTAIGRFLRYGNVHIQYDEGDLYIQDIDSPDQIEKLISVM
ncbi:MAG: hypothetical protein JEZ00_10680 [Anaerolineaceae bacterium]|nr:hypothetical protein [Anaerolineaceae bacterium]